MKRPAWHQEWDRRRAEAKIGVAEVLRDYHPAIADAVLAELAYDALTDRVKREFADDWEAEDVE